MVALLGTMATAVSAQGPGTDRPGPGSPPGHSQDPDGTIWMHTDIITIMANSEIPQMHYWYSNDNGGTIVRFSTAFVMIVEFEDLNADGAYQTNEHLYFAPLSAYEWTVTSGSIEEDGVTTEVWMKYTKSGVKAAPNPSAPIPALDGAGEIQRFSDVTMQIWAHIYLEDYFGEVSDDRK